MHFINLFSVILGQHPTIDTWLTHGPFLTCNRRSFRKLLWLSSVVKFYKGRKCQSITEDKKLHGGITH